MGLRVAIQKEEIKELAKSLEEKNIGKQSK